MNSHDNPQAALREAIQGSKAVIVAGTGVSISATYDPSRKASHPQASWAGLLKHGLAWLKDHRLMDDDEAQAHLRLLSRPVPQTHHFISAAQDVVAGMGGPASIHLRGWLEDTVGTIRATDRSVLDALHALRQHGNLLATTNYDGLLLGDPATLRPVSWCDGDDLVGVVRSRDTNKVIFLHGYWRHPESVILDWDSYSRIAQHDEYRTDLAAFWKLHAWVYVGCGLSGLTDPDLGILLKRYGKRAERAGHFDFCLVRDSEREAFDAFFKEKNFNIRAVTYGSAHSHLAPYLNSLLGTPSVATSTSTSSPPKSTTLVAASVPSAPALYAVPPYIGSHAFVGRETQLEELSDWARPADPTNLLLYEAIGGNGKSMLTWEWMTNPAHALAVRSGSEAWAGRFWYSFYEHGAVMAHFCQHALAYMTGQPLEELRKKKTVELIEPLLDQLHSKPWLIVLDGLERVLVAYHRIDAAQLRDEDASSAIDQIIDRNPRDTIRDEDNGLLRALAAASPSKILVSSRLTPRVLLNPSDQPINGVRRISLPGLRPLDAEKLLRACGVTGDSSAIQTYLAANCDNHPLVIGALGGLIRNDYLPARGDFDVWMNSDDGAAKLDLGRLDLVRRRNHILKAAIEVLSAESRQLLSTLSLLSDSIDYKALEALNPHIRPAPKYVKEPDGDLAGGKSDPAYRESVRQRQDYLAAYSSWQKIATSQEAREALRSTVRDLEIRGLLQFDEQKDRYDLHPVVRAVSSHFQSGELGTHGQRIVDYFSSVPQRPYDEADTLHDVRPGLHAISALLRLGRFAEAAQIYAGGLAEALVYNIEAYAEVLTMSREFFPEGWEKRPSAMTLHHASFITAGAAVALSSLNQQAAAKPLFILNLTQNLMAGRGKKALQNIQSVAFCHREMGELAHSMRLNALSIEMAKAIGERDSLFVGTYNLFRDQSLTGRWIEADSSWKELDPMGRRWPRTLYRPGRAEYYFAALMFWRGELSEEHLVTAERLATEGKSRLTIRDIWKLRGSWNLSKGHWQQAAASFSQAVSMSRSISLVDEYSETGLVLAKLRLGQLDEPRHAIQWLSAMRAPAHCYLVQLWIAIGDTSRARQHAVAAYKDAWADGEPYVKRYALTQATELLEQLGESIPVLPKYDPSKEQPFSWEADIRRVILEGQKLRHR